MERKRMRAWVRGLFAVVLLSAVVANAQSPLLPPENHYKVYKLPVPIAYTTSVVLGDQFGYLQVSYLLLEKFANPVEKRHLDDGQVYPMLDPFAHQTWWRIDVPQPPRTVVGIDQFGISDWQLYDARYLLLPALKNVAAGEPPIRNHYVCYEGIRPPVSRPVMLIDQFGNAQTYVLHGKLFCNPAEKLVSGVTYPIIDYAAHLACYQLEPSPTAPFQHVVALDQFGTWSFDVLQDDCLCVPALKEHVVKSTESTWGKIKALYRQ
jgi:hypothetical protein